MGMGAGRVRNAPRRWENAEAALAWFEAAADTRGTPTSGSREYEHVGQQHHVGKAKYGAINYAEPFLNNQHIAEPTLYYLEHLARKATRNGLAEWRDIEGSLLLQR